MTDRSSRNGSPDARTSGKSGTQESSSEYFRRLRPKFLDWEPPTEEEKAAERQQRQDEKDAELRRVTALAKSKDSKSGKAAAARKRVRTVPDPKAGGRPG